MKYYKAISFFIVIALCLTNTTCDEDDRFPPTIKLNNNQIVHIENNQNTFTVGDSITIETNIFLNQIASDGQDINLSDYDYSEVDQSAYRYFLVLFKQNDFGTTSEIPLTQANISIIDGNTTIQNGGMFNEAIFDGVSYKNKFSISLAETGTYYLAGSRFLIDNNGKFDIDGGLYETSYIKINSTIINANENGGYEFTVN